MKPINAMEAALRFVADQHGAQAAQQARAAHRAYLRACEAWRAGKSTHRPVQPLGWLRRQLLGQALAPAAIDAVIVVYRRQHQLVNRWYNLTRQFAALQGRLEANVTRYGADHPTTARTRTQLERLLVELWT